MPPHPVDEKKYFPKFFLKKSLRDRSAETLNPYPLTLTHQADLSHTLPLVAREAAHKVCTLEHSAQAQLT